MKIKCINNIGKSFFCLLILLTVLTSCNKLVEVAPPYTSTTSANVYATDYKAAAVLTGIYTQLSAAGSIGGGIPSVSLYAGLTADEYTLYSGVTDAIQINCYKNSLSSQQTVDMWSSIYPYIFDVNAAITGLTASNTLTPAVKSQLLGESKFLRAFFYFILVNFYGDVPLVLSTDYTETSTVPRTSETKVYQQIVLDLLDAQNLLNDGYVDATASNVTNERTRPNKWVATSLLSRVYLYTGEYEKASAQATLVINNSTLYALNSIDSVFLKNSKEAIWQWQPVISGYNTNEARLFIIPSTGPNAYQNTIYLSSSLLNSFETGDTRKLNWIDSVVVSGQAYYFPYKYKNNAFDPNITTSYSTMKEYSMVFRLAEQYLIRAEAEAFGFGGGITGAVSDLNIIRNRANLPVYGGATDQLSLLAAILNERRVEFFSEWGHRWFDMKRIGTVDTVMGVPGGACNTKGGVWSSNAALYPIVQLELQRNPALVQNPGY